MTYDNYDFIILKKYYKYYFDLKNKDKLDKCFITYYKLL